MPHKLQLAASFGQQFNNSLHSVSPFSGALSNGAVNHESMPRFLPLGRAPFVWHVCPAWGMSYPYVLCVHAVLSLTDKGSDDAFNVPQLTAPDNPPYCHATTRQ